MIRKGTAYILKIIKWGGNSLMKLTNNENNSDFNNLEKEISKKLNELRKLPEDLKKRKNDDIIKMISYYVDMSNKLDDRRLRIHNFSLQLLAISATGLAILFSNYYRIKLMDFGKFFIYAATIVFSVLIISSLISSIFYVRQSGYRFLFLKLQDYGNNKWKWFYYANKEILKIDRNPIIRTNKYEKTKKPYYSGLLNFLSNYKEENLDKEITDNIQQLYLFQVHNYYKNQFYLQLTKIWNISFLIVLILIPTFAVLYLFFKIFG